MEKEEVYEQQNATMNEHKENYKITPYITFPCTNLYTKMKSNYENSW